MKRLYGLIAATYSPMDEQGNILFDSIEPMVEHLLEGSISGLYVCGSTGEGMSMTGKERKQLAEAYIAAADNRVPVIVQVGHNSLREAADLAEHAATSGAAAVSATCPSYFPLSDQDLLIKSISEIAKACSETPFYYYHIPAFTGSTIQPATMLTAAQNCIPNLAGIKYTDTRLFEFQECLQVCGQAFDAVWGCDEMLLGALASGAKAAIGSTYNVAPKLYIDIMNAVGAGKLEQAQALQLKSVELVRTLNRFPFHSAVKSVLSMRGIHCGSCRLPQGNLTNADVLALRKALEQIGFFDWSR